MQDDHIKSKAVHVAVTHHSVYTDLSLMISHAVSLQHMHTQRHIDHYPGVMPGTSPGVLSVHNKALQGTSYQQSPMHATTSPCTGQCAGLL